MKICIPSKDRAGLMTTQRYTRPSDTYVFVEPSEYKKYKIFYPELNIINIEKNNQGVAYVRNYILDYAKDDKFIMSDDDVMMLGKRNKKRRYDPLYSFDEIIKVASKALDTYAMWGMPSLIFATFVDENQYINKLIVAICAYNTKSIQNIRYDQLIRCLRNLHYFQYLVVVSLRELLLKIIAKKKFK